MVSTLCTTPSHRRALARSMALPPAKRRRTSAAILYTFFVIEFSFCNDNHSSERQSAKESQHAAVVAAFTVLPPFSSLPCIFLLSDTGIYFRATTACLSHLHLHEVSTCHSIVRDRHLECQQPLFDPNLSAPH